MPFNVAVLVPDTLLEYFRNCWSTCIVQPSPGFTEHTIKSIQWLTMVENSLLIAEENGQTGSSNWNNHSYNQSMDESISRTLKQLGYSNRRAHWVSAKNREPRLQVARAYQSWTSEDCSNVAWSDESQCLFNILMVGSESAVTNMNASIHPALH